MRMVECSAKCVMEQAKVLDASIVKDLSNHIYEKRKATAFQIESLTKSALARNDSQTIYNIVKELGELTTGNTNSARMGAITALGSVSVALGSFAIAYFLDDIIKPIFATFRDTDARVRYYACESLYNIAKIARGEILLYFNEVFDILCILVTDSELSVKNAADILDRLIKDIVSAKATNYVSILQQTLSDKDDDDDDDGPRNNIQTHIINEGGTAVQVNELQDPQKAFSLPKFIPTLLERMYTMDPFAKKFLISWLELFDDIPSLELITFLSNFLSPLINFLRNNSPSDVRIETQNLLNTFLKEIRAIAKVKYEVKRRQLVREANDENLAKFNQLSVTDDQESIQSVPSDDTKGLEAQPKPMPDEEEEFLEGQDIFIDYHKIISILLSFLKESDTNNDLTVDTHEITVEIQFIVLRWLNEIIQISPISFTKLFPDCVAITVENLAVTDANKDFDLRNGFLKFNSNLQSLFIQLSDSYKATDTTGRESSLDEINEAQVLGLNKEVYDEFVELQLIKILHTIIGECLTNGNELARVTSLDWLTFLYSKQPSSFVDMQGNNVIDLTALLQSAGDASNQVIVKVLELLSDISETNEGFFKDFMVQLVQFFRAEVQDGTLDGPSLSRSKVEFIIRKLCVTLESEQIFKTVSEVLGLESNLEFVNMMIVTLNNILLTTPELTMFRKKLKTLDFLKIDDWQLFATLFQSWCHNPVSAISLCLLTSNYDLSFLIIKGLSEQEVTFRLLTQLDILIQLLETPVFFKLRLQLLEPEKHPYLFKTLYGLLMILPQSSTYTTLHNRLATVSTVTTLNPQLLTAPAPPGPLQTPASAPGNQQISIKRKRIHEMLDKFLKVQESHERNQLAGKIRETAVSYDGDSRKADKDRMASYRPQGV